MKYDTSKSHTIRCPECKSQQTAFIKIEEPDFYYIHCVNLNCNNDIAGKELHDALGYEMAELKSLEHE